MKRLFLSGLILIIFDNSLITKNHYYVKYTNSYFSVYNIKSDKRSIILSWYFISTLPLLRYLPKIPSSLITKDDL